ncbi:dihydrofolate reductase [Nitratireductor aquibiodomus RA22]|uniref:Dihydrofolate reductase n=1 Tax=Nitratireductor aquibiodomus RA22 TaxID=1189611 RepID=I5C311_9HYPH|nr:dihydrofolate reductase [Nitratireductor aquibiodomus]EIM76213.1 dihydrofolate reductase [Nitratireductor aquibiodomus RA22]
MSVELVVAMAQNGVIGRDGDLPWRLSTDLKRFKAITMGKPVIMGRKTWESIGKPLQGRRNIVVTRQADYTAEGAECVSSLDVALALAAGGEAGADVCVIGGGQVYAEAIDKADRLHVTHVDAQIEGDTVFPEIDPEIWEEVSREEVPAGEKDVYATSYVVYQRR